jgi:uncharacterized protein YbjT (DUF2867 family)
MAPNILVMGASGHVGEELVNRLAHTGNHVRAAVHDPIKLDTLFDYPEIETVKFNFEDQSSITSALQGITSLFLIVPAMQFLSSYVKNFLAAASSVGSLRHIGFLSVLGSDDPKAPELAQWFGQAECALRNFSIPCTILRCNCLMQHLFQYLQPDSAIIYLPAAGGKVSFVDARDVAAVAADLFMPGANHVGKIYNLTGPQTYSMYKVSEILSRVSGLHIGYVESSKENAAIALKGKIADWRLGYLLDYMEYLFQGTGATVTSTIEQIAKIEPVSFVDFARDYAQTIRQIVSQ